MAYSVTNRKVTNDFFQTVNKIVDPASRFDPETFVLLSNALNSGSIRSWYVYSSLVLPCGFTVMSQFCKKAYFVYNHASFLCSFRISSNMI